MAAGDEAPPTDQELEVADTRQQLDNDTELNLSLLRAELALKRDQIRFVRKQTELLDLEIRIKAIELAQLEELKEELKLAKRAQALLHAYQATLKILAKVDKPGASKRKQVPSSEERRSPEAKPFNPPRAAPKG